MESRQKKRLGDMLIEEQIITDEQLSDALEKKKGTTKRLGEVLVELGYTNETDIASYRTKCVDENRFQALKIKG